MFSVLVSGHFMLLIKRPISSMNRGNPLSNSFCAIYRFNDEIGAVGHQRVSSNNSRPINQRRISDVPAPIS
jgi:hypothetical protein